MYFNRNQLDIASSDKKKIKLSNEKITIFAFTAVYIDQKRDLWEIHVYTCT